MTLVPDVSQSPVPHLLGILPLNNLQQLVISAARITVTTSSCFHLKLTIVETVLKVLPHLSSDHSVRCVELKKCVKRDPLFKRTILNYSKLDCDKLTVELNKIN